MLKRACNLLLEQEVHPVWDQILTIGENMLCFSLGNSTPKIIYDLPYNSVDIQNGPNKVHFWKACCQWKNFPLANAINRVWHPICNAKSYQRERPVWLPCPLTHGRLSIDEIWLSRWRHRIHSRLPIFYAQKKDPNQDHDGRSCSTVHLMQKVMGHGQLSHLRLVSTSLSLLDYDLTVPTTWKNMRHVSTVLKQPLIWESRFLRCTRTLL